MNTIEQLEKEQIDQAMADRPVPAFAPGDTLRINVKVIEGSRERIQAFEGVCIGRKNRGINSSFTVRKISYGEGVERVFPLYSPRIDSIQVVRRGDVRRAKLYYLRGRTGKRARIAEKTTGAAGKAAQAERETAAKLKAEARAAAQEAKKEAKSEAKSEAKPAGDGDAAPAADAPKTETKSED